jgi:hypothetical protein
MEETYQQNNFSILSYWKSDNSSYKRHLWDKIANETKANENKLTSTKRIAGSGWQSALWDNEWKIEIRATVASVALRVAVDASPLE